MKDDYYIIYEGDEEEEDAVEEVAFRARAPKEPEAPAKKATDAPPSPAEERRAARIADARERRRRAIEARERRRLERIAARDEKQRALEDRRKQREAEYAKRVREYERAQAERQKGRKGREKPAKVKAAPAPAKQKAAASKAPKKARADGDTGCAAAKVLLAIGASLVLIGLILFGIYYPAEWNPPMADTTNGLPTLTAGLILAGFILLVTANVITNPSVRAAFRRD